MDITDGPPLTHRPPPPRTAGIVPLLVAALAAACLYAPRPHEGAGADAGGRRALTSPAADAPGTLHGGGAPWHAVALFAVAEEESSSRAAPLPVPPDNSATAPMRAGTVGRLPGGSPVAMARGARPASGLASSRLPTGPPPIPA